MGWLFDRNPERRPFEKAPDFVEAIVKSETAFAQLAERLMRHTDALRRLGQMIIERDAARETARQLGRHVTLLQADNARLERQVEYLECRLNHPSQGNRAA